MTLQIFLHFFSSQVCNIPPIHVAALSPQRIADALLTSRLCLSLPHIATPANGASEMRYSLETPFVRSAAEDAWGYRRPTHPALRRCATSPPSPPRPRERSRLQLTPDNVGGTRIDADASRTRRRWHTPAMHLQRHRPAVHLSLSTLSPDALSGVN